MSTGYIAPQYEATRSALVAFWKTKFGANADTSSDEIDGLMIDVQNWMSRLNFEGTAEVYAQTNLGTATGNNIDAILAPLFGETRLSATATTGNVLFYGTIGTVIPDLTAISTIDTAAAFEVTGNTTINATTRAAFILPALGSATALTFTIGGVPTVINTEGTAAEVAFDVATGLYANANVVTTYQAGFQPDGQAIVIVDMTLNWAFSVAGGGAAYDVTQGVATAVATGPTLANYGTLTRPGASIAGWFGLTNIADLTPGTNAESDGAYKVRHAERAARRAFATPRGAAEALRVLVGANGAVKLHQNLSSVTDGAGRPPHSWEFVIDGGTDAAIAELLWLYHTTGTQSYGSTLVIVTDTRGLVDQPREIRFSRPTYKYIHATITVTRGEGFPSIILSDFQTLIATTLATWGNTLGISRDVYLEEMRTQVGRLASGIRSTAITIAQTAAPLDPPTFVGTDLTMGDNDYSRWDASRIAVTIV